MLECAARSGALLTNVRCSSRVANVSHIRQKFRQIDGPTLLVATAIYSLWSALIWFNALVPWWLIMPVGGYLVAWQLSLQHEAIHAFRGVPGWLRVRSSLPAARPVVALPSLSQEPQHSSSRRRSHRAGRGHRVILCVARRMGADEFLQAGSADDQPDHGGPLGTRPGAASLALW